MHNSTYILTFLAFAYNRGVRVPLSEAPRILGVSVSEDRCNIDGGGSSEECIFLAAAEEGSSLT